MKLPIIIDDHGDIEFYASVGDAELDIEPVDARNAEYEAYDAEGRRLRLTTRQTGKMAYGDGGESTVIEEAVPSESRADELAGKLREFLGKVIDDDLAAAELPALVEKGCSFFGISDRDRPR